MEIIYHLEVRLSDNMPYEKIGNSEPVCIADEVPFDIPESWEWVRIGTFLNLQAGKNITSNKIKDYSDSTPYPCYGGNGIRGYVETYNRNGKYPIIGRQGALCGNIKYAEGTFYATEHAVVVEYFDLTDVNWLCVFLTALNLNQYATATAQPGLAVANINNVLLPIPPVHEQIRIYEKYRQLLPLIDLFEQKEILLKKYNKDFPDILRKSILQMAIQGKLVKQNLTDEPASVLLQQIKAEKDSLIKAGKIKKDKNESTIFRRDNSYYEKIGNEERCIDDEIPFDIPESWEWCRLSQLTTKDIKRGKSPKYSETGSVYVFAQKCNVKAGGINLKLAKHIDMSTLDKYPESEYLVDGDIVINSTGNGTLGRIGIFRDFDRIDNCIIVPDSHVTVVRINPQICIEYILAALKAYQPFLEGLGEGSTNQTELKPITVSNLLIPVPPYQEQERIAYNLKIVMELNSSLQE